MSFLFKDWILIPLVGICTFLFVFFMADRVIEFLKKKSLGNKDEIVKLLRVMGAEVNEKKITWIDRKSVV